MRDFGAYWVLGGVLAAAGLACGEENTPSVAQRTCSEVCAKFEQCSDQTDASGCESDCTSTAFRSDVFFTTQAQCAKDLACNRLVTPGGDDLCVGAVDCPLWDCVRDELDVEPTAEQEEVCQEVGNKVEDCNPAVDDDTAEDECLEAVVAMSDAYTEASQECFRESCSGIAACLDDVADSYDANERIYSGPLE